MAAVGGGERIDNGYSDWVHKCCIDMCIRHIDFSLCQVVTIPAQTAQMGTAHNKIKRVGGKTI